MSLFLCLPFCDHLHVQTLDPNPKFPNFKPAPATASVNKDAPAPGAQAPCSALPLVTPRSAKDTWGPPPGRLSMGPGHT